MKKIYSQIAVAIVCALLGFFLSYQFKLIRNKEKTTKENNISQSADILAEVEQLKTERDEAKKQNEELQVQLKKIEDEATVSGNVDKEIKKELDNIRMITGTIDVKGPGIVLHIIPKKDIFTTKSETIAMLDETDLVHIVNSLWYAGAEAISINDFRITPQTGIKNSGNVINIGNEGRVDPKQEVVIKAIGDKVKFNGTLNFAGTLEAGALISYQKDIVPTDDVIINKSVKGLNTNFILPVK